MTTPQQQQQQQQSPPQITDASLDHLRRGSEFHMYSYSTNAAGKVTIVNRRAFLFLRDSPSSNGSASIYGKSGTLFWNYYTSPTAAPSKHEIDTQKLQLDSLTDLRSGKQTEIFRNSVMNKITDNLCFSLTSSIQGELNFSASSFEEREKWWNAIMHKLQSGRKQLLITNSQQQQQQSTQPGAVTNGPLRNGAGTPVAGTSAATPVSAASSSVAASASLSPASLRRVLASGAFFKKFDQDANSKKITVNSVFLWVEGVDKAGEIYWIEATPQSNFSPPPSSVLPPTHCLSLSKITDFMLRKKSPALRASTAPESCCFALVASDKTMLNLECESKDMCRNWREGLIAMLLTAGKQVVRAETPNGGERTPTPVAVAQITSLSTMIPAPIKVPPVEDRELILLTTGAVFTLYYTNNKHAPESAKITLFFVELAAPSDPGALCWCNVGSKRMIEGQRLMLNSMKQMISGCDHSSFRHAAPNYVDLDPDRCFTIVGKSLILNLEAAGHSIREGWMQALHSIMLRYQQLVAEKKRIAQETAAKAAREIIASNDAQFAAAAAASSTGNYSPPPPAQLPLSISPSRSPSPSLSSSMLAISGGPLTPGSHSPPSAVSLAALEENIAKLRLGNCFTLYTPSSSSPSDLLSHAIFLFYVDVVNNGTNEASSPGYLYYCSPPPAPRQMLDNQRFSLSSLSRMVAGKETAVFNNDKMKAIPGDRCLSIIGKHSTLNVEAPQMEIRDFWIKTLHAIMTRYKQQKQLLQQQQQILQNQPGTPLATSANFGNSPAPAIPSIQATTSSPLPSSSTIPILTPPISPFAAVSAPPPLPVPPLLSPSSAPSLASEPEAIYLSTPHSFKLYSTSPVGFPLIIDISLFFVPLSGSDHPGALFWCNSGKKEMKETQKLLLNKIQKMAGGKETPIFNHLAAAAVPKEKCLYLTSSTLSLSLEAPSAELKNIWMQNLHALMIKMGRQTVDEKKQIPKLERARTESTAANPAASSPFQQATQPGMSAAATGGSLPSAMIHQAPVANGHPPSPTTPNGIHVGLNQLPPPSPSPPSLTPSPAPGGGPSGGLAKSTVDIKTALQTVQAGQVFTMYHLNENNEQVADKNFFFFQPSSGAEQPGVLYWSSPDHPFEVNNKQRFILNTIKQMRAGKDTPILKSAIAARARSSHCLSLSSSSITLNLEAPNAEVAELWRKSLHTVLVRHGMKAVEDAPAAHAAAGVSSTSLPSEPRNGVNGGSVTPGPPGSARPLMPSAISSHIGRTINFMDPTEFFSLKAKIGEGSYGAVYKAIDHRDNSQVAIKVIPFSGKDSLKLRKEIRTLRQCHSPFIVGYKGAFHKNENVWIVMEYCHAGSLSDMMQICKRTLSEVQISNVMKQCLAGLAYLHGQGKIHRDIKGGNVLSDANGMCKLADFGVSGNLDKTLGKHRTVIGTPHWMAPEVLMSDDYNELADIWSLGITAYELAIGEPPHAKLHSMRAALKIPMSPPPTLPDPQHWSPHFHSFLAACLVKDFHTRPSAAELLSHPFIVNAASAAVLMDMVKQSVKVIEAKANELAKEQGLANNNVAGAAPATPTAAGAAAAAAGVVKGEAPIPAAATVKATVNQSSKSVLEDVDEDDDDDEDDLDEDAPRIRPNPRGI